MIEVLEPTAKSVFATGKSLGLRFAQTSETQDEAAQEWPQDDPQSSPATPSSPVVPVQATPDFDMSALLDDLLATAEPSQPDSNPSD